jgi:outer membrane lipoprotein-sorting protein
LAQEKAQMIRKFLLVSGLAAGLGAPVMGGSLTAAESATPPKPPAKPAPAKPAPTKPFVPMDQATALQKANAYLNETQTMIADFVQIGGDGRRSEGKLLVQKPGHLRFEYAAPATLDIIADGTNVAVIDRKMSTQELYFIWQTPLKFLLKDQIDLAHDVTVTDVVSDPNSVSIMIEDKNTFGGTSHIKLVFDPAKFALKQWQVTDPQGNEVLVSLFNVDTVRKPDPATFRIFPAFPFSTNN